MSTAPMTIPECDKLLIITHNRFLAAMECVDCNTCGPDELAQVEARGRAFALAAELWSQLYELLDVRISLPQQRTP